MRDRDELHVERADPTTFAVDHRHEIGASEQTRFLDPTTGQSECDGRTEDRELGVAQEELQTTDVIFVTVGGHTPLDAVGVLAQPGEVG